MKVMYRKDAEPYVPAGHSTSNVFGFMIKIPVVASTLLSGFPIFAQWRRSRI